MNDKAPHGLAGLLHALGRPEWPHFWRWNIPLVSLGLLLVLATDLWHGIQTQDAARQRQRTQQTQRLAVEDEIQTLSQALANPVIRNFDAAASAVTEPENIEPWTAVTALLTHHDLQLKSYLPNPAPSAANAFCPTVTMQLEGHIDALWNALTDLLASSPNLQRFSLQAPAPDSAQLEWQGCLAATPQSHTPLANHLFTARQTAKDHAPEPWPTYQLTGLGQRGPQRYALLRQPDKRMLLVTEGSRLADDWQVSTIDKQGLEIRHTSRTQPVRIKMGESP